MIEDSMDTRLESGAVPGIKNHDSEKLKSKSDLLNSYKYFIEHVQVLCYEEFYRLLIIHKNRLLNDRCFRSMKAAKIAFCRLHGHRAKPWKNKPDPEWSQFLDFAGISKSNIDLKSLYIRMSRV